jgi:hypothetical protein
MAGVYDWAPIFWACLHYIAASFPENSSPDVRKKFVKYMDLVAKFLPCSLCGQHLNQHLEQHPLYVHTATREGVERYFYDLHEEGEFFGCSSNRKVNDRRQIPKDQRLTFEEVQHAYR